MLKVSDPCSVISQISVAIVLWTWCQKWH